MNITLSIDEQTVKAARKVAATLGKSLNQLIREDLQRMTQQARRERDLQELRSLAGQGNSNGWRFNREELHDRT